MITKEQLIEIGKMKGLYNKEYIEKDYFQDIFLFNLYKRTNILAFKGGTALYKLYGLGRFSEDLDFSLLEEKADIENILRDVMSKIENFEIKSIKFMQNSLLIKIGIKGILTNYNTLRLDIALKNIPLKECDIKNLVPEYIDIAPFSLKTLKIEEIIAEKIHSILSRQKARDIYDLFFLLRMSKIDKKLTEEKLKLFGMKYDLNLISKRISNLKSLWISELKPFVFEKLTDFNIVEEFVISKLKEH